MKIFDFFIILELVFFDFECKVNMGSGENYVYFPQSLNFFSFWGGLWYAGG